MWQSPFLPQAFPGPCCPLLSPPSIVLTPPPPAANRGSPSANLTAKIPKLRMGDDSRRCFRVTAVFQCCSVDCLPALSPPVPSKLSSVDSHHTFGFARDTLPHKPRSVQTFYPHLFHIIWVAFCRSSWVFAARFLTTAGTCSFYPSGWLSANHQ